MALIINNKNSTFNKYFDLLNHHNNSATACENAMNVLTFASQNVGNPQAQAFAVFAIQALGEVFHSTTTFGELLEILNYEQDYRGQMSNNEIAIFDSINRTKQLKYLQSAYNAITLMESLYPSTTVNPCSFHNGQGDAFRHALWNALSTVRLGEILTEQLTTAHENKPIPTGYTASQYNKEKQMDLYNNARGRELAFTSGLVWQAVKDAKENGNLRYLSNLNFNCLPTSSSNLTFTN